MGHPVLYSISGVQFSWTTLYPQIHHIKLKNSFPRLALPRPIQYILSAEIVIKLNRVELINRSAADPSFSSCMKGDGKGQSGTALGGFTKPRNEITEGLCNRDRIEDIFLAEGDPPSSDTESVYFCFRAAQTRRSLIRVTRCL